MSDVSRSRLPRLLSPCTPSLASSRCPADDERHEVYRRAAREHLHNITLRHWDIDMRKLGAKTLRAIVELGSESDRDDAIRREVGHQSGSETSCSCQMSMLLAVDSASIHGGLLALSELATTLKPDDGRREKVSNNP